MNGQLPVKKNNEWYSPQGLRSPHTLASWNGFEGNPGNRLGYVPVVGRDAEEQLIQPTLTLGRE